jgi:hypothetical protein
VLAKAGDVRAYQGATQNFPVLAKAGYVRADTLMSDDMADILLNACKGTFWGSDQCSEYLLKALKVRKKSKFTIDSVEFPFELFDAIRHGTLSASEVFAINNAEQRRVAYNRMDKSKMAALNPAILNEVLDDGYEHPMKLVEVQTKAFSTPFRYLNCFCPSSGREFWLETRSKSCWAAKMGSFGLPETERFDREY